MKDSRRDFLKKSTFAGLAATLMPGARVVGPAAAEGSARKMAGPIAISSNNGQASVQRAIEVIQGGGDALDAVIAGVNIVEADPDDMSVGYGGLPNEDGVVQLDSSVMHGPSCRAGAVAALEGIMHPSKVARLVLERTDHALLVGEGALRFARMHGFQEEDLLTDRAREVWVRWKENLSHGDDYISPQEASGSEMGVDLRDLPFTYGTIHCSAIDLSGDISGVTTTSGLAFKIPGRVGDSPIIGAGLYVDNEVGAAGSTGRGEANLENLSCFMIVERMRMGDSPQEACLNVCQRIADHTRLSRLLDDEGRPSFNVKFYALDKEGVVGGAEIWGGNNTFAVADASGLRLEPLAYLYQRNG